MGAEGNNKENKNAVRQCGISNLSTFGYVTSDKRNNYQRLCLPNLIFYSQPDIIYMQSILFRFDSSLLRFGYFSLVLFAFRKPHNIFRQSMQTFFCQNQNMIHSKPFDFLFRSRITWRCGRTG